MSIVEHAPGAWPRSHLAGLVLGFALLGGTALRAWGVGHAFLFGDELHSLSLVVQGYGSVLGHFGDKGSGLALPLLQRLLFDVFGAGHWTIRAPAWIPALALLFAVWLIGRRIVGDAGAVAAVALVAINPALVFYARFGRIYSLVALLSLVLLYLLERELGADSPRRARRLSLVVVTALLPWAHPTALGLVLPLYIGALLALALDRDRAPALRRRLALSLLGCLTAAGVACLFAYAPVWSSFWQFVESRTAVLEYPGRFGPWDVATLLFGGRWPAVAVGLLALCASALWLRLRGAMGLPLLSACLGPPLVIAAIQPYGDAYAYARYVLPCVAPIALLIGAGLSAAVRRVGRISAHAGVTAGIGAAVACALALAGTTAASGGAAAQHANTYLGLLALPAFDARWPEAPAFYGALGRGEMERRVDEEGRDSTRILEIPALTTRTRHLYRQYQLQHGAETWLSPLPGEFPLVPDGPYVSLGSGQWLAESSPDYVILHLDVANETARYWQWVDSAALAATNRSDLGAYMERHRSYGGAMPKPPKALVDALSALLGAPVFEDGRIVVWAGPRSSGRG